MVLPRVQRSGRTSIRATTRSFSASVKVTPFSSAKGIFIEFTRSSGVMIGNPPVFLPGSYADLTRVSIKLRQKHFSKTMDRGVKPGNDVPGNGYDDNRPFIRHILRHAPIPSPPDRVSHRGNRGDAVSTWRAGAHCRRLRLCGAAGAGPAREAAGIGVYLGRYSEDPEARARPRSGFLRLAGRYRRRPGPRRGRNPCLQPARY